MSYVEYALAASIQTTVSAVLADHALADEFMWNLSSDIRTSFVTWLTNNPIVVIQAWPGTAIEVPAVVIYPEVASETEEFIGDSETYWKDTNNQMRPIHQITMQGSFAILITTANADMTAYLSGMVAWGLFREKNHLQASQGITQARVGYRSLTPRDQLQPDRGFSRIVTFSCNFYEIYTDKPLILTPTEIDVGTIKNIDNQETEYPT